MRPPPLKVISRDSIPHAIEKAEGYRLRNDPAQAMVDRLSDPYERAYYTGIVCERKARALLKQRNVVRSSVYDGLREAMDWYERAEAIRPVGNDDAVLRWNSCVRAIASELPIE